MRTELKVGDTVLKMTSMRRIPRFGKVVSVASRDVITGEPIDYMVQSFRTGVVSRQRGSALERVFNGIDIMLELLD